MDLSCCRWVQASLLEYIIVHKPVVNTWLLEQAKFVCACFECNAPPPMGGIILPIPGGVPPLVFCPAWKYFWSSGGPPLLPGCCPRPPKQLPPKATSHKQLPHLHFAVNPTEQLCDLSVDPWLVPLATAGPPAGDSGHVPTVAVLADQRTATVTLRQRGKINGAVGRLGPGAAAGQPVSKCSCKSGWCSLLWNAVDTSGHQHPSKKTI